MIECTLKQMRKNSLFPAEKNERCKFGTYLSSVFPVVGFGTKKWVVAMNLFPETDTLSEENVESVASECISFLNTPPINPESGRRRRKPLYGEFDKTPYQARLKFDENDKPYIQALLITREKKNKMFWGRGENVSFLKKRKK